MMNNRIFVIIWVSLLVIAIIVLSLCIFVWIKYANVPLKDLPAWVLPFFGK